jgi:hypothetical protein
MDVEKTMRFLMGTAAQHDARLAEIERNNVLIQQAVLGLTEHQGVLQTALEQTQKILRDTQIETDRRLRELGENTDRRIAQVVSAIATLAETRPN